MKKRNMMAVIACLAIVFMVVILVKYFSRTQNKGTVVEAINEYTNDNVVIYQQVDERWATDKLGSTDNTMADSGGLTTCIAAALQMQKQSSDKDFALTPGELNEIFSSKSVYDKNGNIVWNNIRNAIKDLDVYVGGKVDNSIIDKYLSKGRYPLVRVKNNDNNMQWLIIVSANAGEYMCVNPLGEEISVVPLSDYKNTVYSVRCVYYTK